MPSMPSLSLISLAGLCLSSAIPLASASDSGSQQTLRPVRKDPSLRRRHIDFTPRFDGHELHYTDYDTVDELQEPFVARVSLEPRQPTVVLDDLSDQLHAVTCKKDSLTVAFRNPDPMLDARRAWSKNVEFLMIVTPSLCGNDWDEHASYMVSNISWDEEDSTATLLAKETTLKKATKSMTVSLGRSLFSSIDKRDVEKSVSRTELSKRAAQGDAGNGNAAPAPTSVSANLAINQVSKTILPPTGTNSAAYSTAADNGAPIPTNVIIECISCKSRGHVTLSAGDFTIDNDENADDSNDVDLIPDESFSSGFLEFTASEFSGRFELGIDFLAGTKAEVTLGKIPGLKLPNLKIGRSLNIAPRIEYGFPVSITTENPVNVTTGFTIDIPTDSSVRVDLSNPTDSKVTGFPKASLKALPFDTDAPHPNFTVTAGFQPGIALTTNPGAKNSKTRSGTAGIMLELPQLRAQVAEVHNRNAHCRRPPPGPVFDDLISVKPSVALQGKLQVPTQDERTLFEVVRDLPNLCYQYDESTHSLIKPGSGADKGHKPHRGRKGSGSGSGSGVYAPPPPPAQTGTTTNPAAYPGPPTPAANPVPGNGTVPGSPTGTGVPVSYTGGASAEGKRGLVGWSVVVGLAAAGVAGGL